MAAPSRWYGPLLAGLGYAALVALFFAPVLFTERVLLPLDNLLAFPPWRAINAPPFVPHNPLIGDAILQNYSWKQVVREAYFSGQFPLWNPAILTGQPFLAGGQNGALYPLGALYLLLPLARAYAWFTALHLWLAACFAYAWLRVLGARRAGAFLGGAAFAFNAFLVVSFLWPMVVSTAIWLPLVLLAVEQVVGLVAAGERPTTRGRLLPAAPWVLLGAAAVGLQFLAGHAEISLYLLGASGLYALARLAYAWWRWRRPLATIAAAAALLFMVGLGAGLAAVQLVPFAEAISRNSRAGQTTYEEVAGYALPPQHVLAFLVPDIFGNPTHHTTRDLLDLSERSVAHQAGREQRFDTEWGKKNYVEGAAYIGVLPLLLAAAALRHRRSPAVAALAFVAVVCLLLAFGSPLYRLVFALPGLNQVHSPFRWVYPFLAVVATLAGLGLSARLDQPAAGRRLGLLALVAAALLLLSLASAFLLREQAVAFADALLARSSSLRRGFGEGRVLFSYQWWNLLRFALLLALSGLLLWRARGRLLAAGAVALVVLDLFSYGIAFNTAADPAILEQVPPAIQFLQADRDLFRITTYGSDDTLPANTGMLFGLHDIRGYDTIIPRDYVDFLELIEPQTMLIYSKVEKLFRRESLASPLLDLLNVRYLLTTRTVNAPGWVLAYDGEVRVYRNQEALPRAFTIGRVRVVDGREAALAALGDPAFDPRRELVLERDACGGCDPAGLPPELDGAPATPAVITHYGANRVRLAVDLPAPRYLVLLDSYAPGWEVEVDGQRAELARANWVFRAVLVPAGQHQVEFVYRPLSFRAGLLGSGAAGALFLLVLGVWAWGRLGAGLGQASAAQRVAKNSLLPMATSLLNKVLDLGFALIVLRVLGPAGVGQYTFAVGVIGYLDIVVNFGLGTLLTREVARESGQLNRYFANTVVTRLLLWSLALPALGLLLVPLGPVLGLQPEVALAIALFALGLVPSNLAGAASAAFMARELMEVPAAVTVLTTIMRIIIGGLALLLGLGYVGLAATSVVVNTLTAAILLALLWRLVYRPRLEFDVRFSLKMLRSSYPLMLNNLLSSLFFRVDVLLLKPMAGDAALGYYGTAYKFIDGLNIIPSNLTLALFPLLSRFASERSDQLSRAFSGALKILLLISLPICVGTTLLAEFIIHTFAGPAYLPHSAIALALLIWFLPFSFVNSVTHYVLIALDKQRYLTLCFVIGASFNVAANLVAIPHFGYMGASVVTVVSEIVLLLPFWWAVRQGAPGINLLALGWRPLLASGAMGAVVWWARDVSPLVAVPVGALVYLGALMALRTFDAEDRALLRRLARR